MTLPDAVAAVALLALMAADTIATIRAQRRTARAERLAREWAETCARWPWRVAAVRDGGPLMLHLGDAHLRAWWESEGRRLPENADLVAMETTR